ncbi:hypothetical protein AL052_07150 [Pseudomonas amygdali pv. eriobotryae]|nr:hypothetical protein AL052_07150 [Pseudomonas amygdali pv. eriobotryae]
MQVQHVIILVGIAACFLLLAVSLKGVIKRAIRRTYLAGKPAGNQVLIAFSADEDGFHFTKPRGINISLKNRTRRRR